MTVYSSVLDLIGNQYRRGQRQGAVHAGGQVAVLLHGQAHVEEAVHRWQETVDAVLFPGKTELGHAPHDLFFEFFHGHTRHTSGVHQTVVKRKTGDLRSQ